MTRITAVTENINQFDLEDWKSLAAMPIAPVTGDFFDAEEYMVSCVVKGEAKSLLMSYQRHLNDGEDPMSRSTSTMQNLRDGMRSAFWRPVRCQ